MRIFKKYRPEMDKNPMLELQEIEAERSARKMFETSAAANAVRFKDGKLEMDAPADEPVSDDGAIDPAYYYDPNEPVPNEAKE
jgi:hypothetical protein